jgi:hypothetical protein
MMGCILGTRNILRSKPKFEKNTNKKPWKFSKKQY